MVVAVEGVVQTLSTPHLRETGVDIQEHPSRRGGRNLGVVDESHHVQQERRLAEAPEDLPAGQAHELAAIVVQHGIGVAEAESVHDHRGEFEN